MKLFKSLIITALCLFAFASQAQTQQQFIDTKCAELASDEFRAEMELKRIKAERVKLNASKMELNVKLYQEQLTQLELKKANDVAKIESEYLRAKGEIMAKMQVSMSVQSNPQCVPTN